MTVSSTFPPDSSDPLFASKSSSQPSQPLQQNYRQGLEKLIAFSQRAHFLPALALCVALCGMSCASIFIVMAERELSPFAIAFNRLLIASIAFALWNKLSQLAPQPQASFSSDTLLPQTDNKPHFRFPLLLLLAGLCFSASLSLSAWSLTQTSVANSTLLNNMMPLFTTLGAWLFLGQRFSFKFLVGLAVAISGVLAIGIQDLHITGNQIMGDAAALAAAILLAVTLLSMEQLRSQFSASSIMLGISFTGSLVIFPLLLLSHNALFPTTWFTGLSVLGLALISQVIGHGLLTYSLKQFSSGLVSVSMLAIPMLATGLAMVLFSQQLSLTNGIAFLVVLMGIYLSITASKCSPAVSSTASTEV